MNRDFSVLVTGRDDSSWFRRGVWEGRCARPRHALRRARRAIVKLAATASIDEVEVFSRVLPGTEFGRDLVVKWVAA